MKKTNTKNVKFCKEYVSKQHPKIFQLLNDVNKSIKFNNIADQTDHAMFTTYVDNEMKNIKTIMTRQENKIYENYVRTLGFKF